MISTRVEQGREALVEPLPAELRLELLGLRRRRDLGVEGNGDQRRQRRQLREHRGNPL